jgi:hypothetical protein
VCRFGQIVVVDVIKLKYDDDHISHNLMKRVS